MSMLDGTETDNTKKFNKLLDQLEHCNEDEQKQKIGEMNEEIDGMNKEEFRSIFKTELFKKMDKMIEEKKMSMENAILLLKHAGYLKVLKNIWILDFRNSSLNKRIEKMIFEEEKKKEGKNEWLLVELCECFTFLKDGVTLEEFPSVCVPCLLKAALRKEENEESQKEVEMALLALSDIGRWYIEQKLYLKEITEIIEHQQKHRNLTKLAYQSAWLFFIDRFYTTIFLKDMIVNELHFGREAARELEELTRCIDWKKKEEEMNKEEAKEKLTLTRWIETLNFYFLKCKLRNEELVELFSGISYVYRAAKGDNHRGIRSQCVCSLIHAAGDKVVRDEDLLRSGAISAVLEEIQRPTIVDKMAKESLLFFTNVSNRLKEKKKNEMEEVNRKATKKEILEKMEEEGYEDTITSFHEKQNFILGMCFHRSSFSFSDYFVDTGQNSFIYEKNNESRQISFSTLTWKDFHSPIKKT